MRAVKELVLGAIGGLTIGAFVGAAEALYHLSTAGAPDLLAPLYATVLYGLLGAAFGLGGGFLAAAASFVREEPQGLGWGLGGAAAFTALAGFVLKYMVNKVVYAEAGIPLTGWAGIAAVIGVTDLVLIVVGVLAFRSARGQRLGDAVSLGAVVALVAVTGVLSLFGGGQDPRDHFAVGKPVPPALKDKPNTMIVMVDTLRADYLGTYGKSGDPSPNIDAFARDAVVFEQAIAGSSWTRPSGASLMTGRLPSGHGATTKAARMSDDVKTCFEVQHEAGVTTGALINNINMTQSFNFDQGFDRFVYESPVYPFGATESVFGLTWYKVVHKVREKVFGGHKVVEEFYQPAEVVLDDAKAFVQANKDARWSLFVHLMEPHDPYFEHPYLMGSSADEFNGVGFARAEVEHPDPAKADYLKMVYTQEITHMDRKLADFFAWLKAEGVYDDTLILFTSDHGEEFAEHGGWWHGTTLYDEQVHVPLIVKLPGNAHAGARIPYQVRQFDTCVTAVVAQGLAPDPTWDGRDLLADLKAALAPPPVAPEGAEGTGTPEAPEAPPPAPVDPCETRRHALGRPALSEIDFEGNVVTSLRRDGWKVIRANEGNPRGQPTTMLFDVSVDPGETENLIDQGAERCGLAPAARARAMDEERAKALELIKAGGAQAGVAEMSDAEKQNLCALGYLSGEDCE